MSEDANIQEGIRCFEKAKNYARNGAFTQANRLCVKALRMIPASSDLAEKLRQFQKNLETSPFQKDDPEHDNLRERKTREFKNSGESPVIDKELEEKCRCIIISRDYYQILGVSKDAPQEEIKKAYRKLALQCHPDKARCPSAEAAFKQISKAYQCLSNPQAKEHYDTHGLDESNGHQHQEQYEAHFMTPEELFESFFFNTFAGGGVYQTRTYRTAHQSYRTPQAYSLIQILPFFILVIFFLLSTILNSYNQPLYSMSWSPSYYMSKTTPHHNVVYYVGKGFSRNVEQKGKLHDIEIQVEMNYFAKECSNDLEELYRQLKVLKFYGTNKQYQQKLKEIRLRETTSEKCATLQQLKSRYPKIYENLQSASKQSFYYLPA